MDKKEGVREIYNKRARVYDRKLSRYRYHEGIRKVIERIKFKEEARILDLGCGTGLVTGVLYRANPHAKIIGMDFSEGMLEIYKKRFPENKAVLGDFNKPWNLKTYPENLEFAIQKESFDAVISTGAVSEYGNENAVKFVFSILKKSGIFINIGIKNNFMSLVTRKVWVYRPMGKKDFLQYCYRSGFQKANKIRMKWESFPTNITKYAIVAKK